MKQNLRFRGCYCPKRIQPICLFLLTTSLLLGSGWHHAFGQVNLTGTVIDTTGAAISGATITIKSTPARTLTDEQGRFTLRSPEPSGTLVITYLGHRTINERFGEGNSGPFHFVLVPDENLLEEVEVSTGYQTIPREQFVGSFSKLDSTAFQRRAGMGIIERLDGTVSGVVFDKKMGTTDLFQVRGISTLGGVPSDPNQLRPLIVLDNFPFEGELTDINPNDVASVTVLKDAAAASIWGSRAGNGVVIITTKTGKFNQSGRVTVRSNMGMDEKPALFYYPRMSSAEFVEVERFLYERGYFDADLANDTYPFAWPVVSPVVELLDGADRGLISRDGAEREISKLAATDYRDELSDHWYRPAFRQQHYLDLSGGGEKHAYSVSAGYDRSLNNIRGSSGRQGVTLAINNIFRPAKGLQVDANLNYSLADDRTPRQMPQGKPYPYLKLVNEDGTPAVVPTSYRMAYIDTAGAGQLLDWHLRPLEEVERTDNLDRQQLTRLNVGVNYKILPWLQAELRYQYMGRQTGRRDYFSVDTWYARDLINRYTNPGETAANLRHPVPVGGILDLSNGSQGSNHYRGQLRANHNWNGVHVLGGMLAVERTQATRSAYSSRLYGYDDDYGTYQSNMDFQRMAPMYNSFYTRNAVPAGAGYREAYLTRTVSILGNLAYTYKKRYNLYASARRDGSNLFGVETNNKWKPLWSVGGSWDVAEEGFSLPGALEHLRLRASYGYTGNANNSVSGYPTMSYQPVTSRNLNELPWAQMQTPPNPSLRWEQVRMVNGGMDFGLFRGRLRGGVEWFHKTSTDLISSVPFDPTTGVSLYTVNAASLRGNGFEVDVNSFVAADGFRWEIGFNLSYVKMKVAKVYNSGFRARDFIDYGLQPSEGMVAYGISSYRWAGLDPETGDPMGYLEGGVSKDYTGIFNDLVANQRFHGSAIPLYAGFFSNALRWRSISLSANLTYRLGFHFRQPALRYGSVFNANGLHGDYSKRWQQPGDERHTHVPAMLYPVPAEVALRDDFYAASEIHVKRGDNLRLQDVRIGYEVASAAAGRVGLGRTEVFAYGNNLNLILWKAYRGRLDADFTGGNDPSAAPLPRSWTMGINIGF